MNGEFPYYDNNVMRKLNSLRTALPTELLVNSTFLRKCSYKAMAISNPHIPEFDVNKLIDEIQCRFQFIIHSHPISMQYSMSYLQLHLVQWSPTFFHLHTPWQPISINCTFHIGKIIVINIVAVISNL